MILYNEDDLNLPYNDHIRNATITHYKICKKLDGTIVFITSESICRVRDQRFGLIYLDEISTIRRSWAGSTHKKRWWNNVKIFERLLNHGKMAMDADMNSDDVRLIQFFQKDIIILKSAFPRTERNIHEIMPPKSKKSLERLRERQKNDTSQKACKSIGRKIEEGTAAYRMIINFLKKGQNVIAAIACKYIVDTIVEYVTREGYQEGKHFSYYTSDTKTAINVSTWNRLRLVAYSPTIEPDIDFNPDRSHFDVCWAHGSAASINVLGLAQMLERDRKFGMLVYSVQERAFPRPRKDIPLLKNKIIEWCRTQYNYLYIIYQKKASPIRGPRWTTYCRIASSRKIIFPNFFIDRFYWKFCDPASSKNWRMRWN